MVGEGVRVDDALTELVGEALGLGVKLSVGVLERVDVDVDDLVLEPVGVFDCVGLCVERVEVGDTEGVGDPVDVVLELVAVAEDAVAESVFVMVEVEDAVEVSVYVGVNVRVRVSDTDGVLAVKREEVFVSLRVNESVGVAVVEFEVAAADRKLACDASRNYLAAAGQTEHGVRAVTWYTQKGPCTRSRVHQGPWRTAKWTCTACHAAASRCSTARTSADMQTGAQQACWPPGEANRQAQRGLRCDS
eukprot:gene3648-biopygen3621